ncbi:MAG: retroviral-like aspartic protease family protein [Lachnospiraceae bacterium]|nr:retroviral-like aspartic protease family protein [Lachnospiraceae bacterium]
MKAVWDTGATSSCISQKAVRALGLQRVSYRKIYTVNSSAEVKTYYVGLELPNYFMTTVTASALASISDDVDVVIGMDVISRGDFSVTNVLGKTTFSFRIPSVREVDYEQEPLMNGE